MVMFVAPNFWFRSHFILAYLFSPFSLLYYIIFCFRNWLYRIGVRKIWHFDVPVIVVGNITVGGSGKTPLVSWLACYLKKQGFRPGLVSRGYGGSGSVRGQATIVTVDSDVDQVGDEAVLLVKQTSCPMVVSENRPMAVNSLLHHFDCDVVIADDGLQHHALGRDIEIVVMDDEVQCGNGFLFPAGPLREPKSKLDQVDFVVVNTISEQAAMQHVDYHMRLFLKGIHRVVGGSDYSVSYSVDWHDLRGETVHAVCGVGNPNRFFKQLRHKNVKIIPHVFPDHHYFKKEDFNFSTHEKILMTEKDAVKCQAFADDRMWFVLADVRVSDYFKQAVLEKVMTVFQIKKLSRSFSE